MENEKKRKETIERLKFEVSQECGIIRSPNQSKKNIKKS